MGPQGNLGETECSVEALNSNGMQRAGVLELDGELDGPAAHLAIFDVFALAGSQVDARFEAFTAPGTLNRHELLRLEPCAGRVRLEHRLEPIELVDVLLVAAFDAPLE